MSSSYFSIVGRQLFLLLGKLENCPLPAAYYRMIVNAWLVPPSGFRTFTWTGVWMGKALLGTFASKRLPFGLAGYVELPTTATAPG